MTFFFLLISLLLALLYNSQVDLIVDVYFESVNPSLCNSSLRSNPRSRGADLSTLAQIAIDKAGSATNAILKVTNLLINGSDM